MTLCVCGHAEFLHTNQSCLKWFTGCGCTVFYPDDGGEHGGPCTVARAENYDGFYATWKKWI